MSYPRFVEAKDVRFDITETNAQGVHALKIRGLIFHSSLAVKNIEITRHGQGTVHILVMLTPTGRGLSGSFDIDLPLQPSDMMVVFGPAEVQIWPPI